jgi:hypothetical protein
MRTKRRALIGMVCICLLTISGTCLGIKYRTQHTKSALVKQECWLTAGTDERFSKICMLKKGHEVFVQESKAEWYKVKSNGCIGWILAENVEYI